MMLFTEISISTERLLEQNVIVQHAIVAHVVDVIDAYLNVLDAKAVLLLKSLSGRLLNG